MIRSRAALLATLLLLASTAAGRARGRGPAVPHPVPGGVPRRRARLDQRRSARDPAAGASRRAAGGDRGAVPALVGRAARRDGWVVGTGNAGRVLRIDASGKVEELFTAAEPEVFAVWADAKGTVFAGSSPDGKVYRHADGKAEVFFDPERDLHLGSRRRRQRRSAGGDRHRGQALPRRERRHRQGALRQRRRPSALDRRCSATARSWWARPAWASSCASLPTATPAPSTTPRRRRWSRSRPTAAAEPTSP